ncbi:hypothetical protein EB093_02275 [bacterium]|nr:hypothetical protein [bacterium]
MSTKSDQKAGAAKLPNRSVTLKRTVTIKVLVTEKFKSFMQFELNEGIKNAEQRIQLINQQIPNLNEIAPGDNPGRLALIQQLEAEKIQLEATISDQQARATAITNLQLDSLFVQGTVDGFVSVSEGDNMYEKLGGMEIILKDGIVQKINPVGSIEAA